MVDKKWRDDDKYVWERCVCLYWVGAHHNGGGGNKNAVPACESFIDG